ncbi:MAG: FtsX-like permease family protein, partial [Coriobacteriales bacterium]|nr:FtsX-like permease family protein [Coriobacteriales bacterium]
ATLDSGWATYNANKLAYTQKIGEGKQQISEGERQLEASQQQLNDGEKQLADSKTQLDEKTQELEQKKSEFNDAKEAFKSMVEYEWVVTPRNENGGMQLADSTVQIMDRVRWAMASLFIIVGLFVCYSAISRLVYEQIVQIGTKKALGFRAGEIRRHYYAFTALAVLVGMVICALLGVFMVQTIMNPKAAMRFSIPEYGPSFNIVDVLMMGAIELVLMLGSTWFAMHTLLKREALDLLRGESTANVKERWYEHLRIWQRMSLYSQTIVNNCVNDKRRVIGTIIGVMGCTALITSAVTLAANVGSSIVKHYKDVYNYDRVVYLDETVENAADNVSKALYDKGLMSAPVNIRQVTMRPEGSKNMVARLVVPMNEDAFRQLYHVNSMDGSDNNIENGGLWMSAAYAEHYGAKAGDEVTLTEFSGKTHTFKIAGFFEYYLLRNEFVLSQREYRQAFGDMPKTNAIVVNTGDYNPEALSNALMDVKGYQTLYADREDMERQYNSIVSILNSVVLIYLMLSGLMALIVLLNLDIMFVNEKKRELIVLMINGFSVKQAKAYIYRDSIVLTIAGILIGVLFGSLVGNITVSALEPNQGFFIKAFNWIAMGAGAVGAGFFATVVLLYALRMIPRFKLTDINRY